MKKIVLILLVSVIAVIFILGCEEEGSAGTQDAQKKTKTLSEMQATACDAANEAGTCDTRLAELGIVLKEDCCEALGKCC